MYIWSFYELFCTMNISHKTKYNVNAYEKMSAEVDEISLISFQTYLKISAANFCLISFKNNAY